MVLLLFMNEHDSPGIPYKWMKAPHTELLVISTWLSSGPSQDSPGNNDVGQNMCVRTQPAYVMCPMTHGSLTGLMSYDIPYDVKVY